MRKTAGPNQTARIGDTDVLVSMAFTAQMAATGSRLRLVQVPGAGLDRIDRSQLRKGLALANAYGHEAAIAEYVMGSMIALTRSFQDLCEQRMRETLVAIKADDKVRRQVAFQIGLVECSGDIRHVTWHRHPLFDAELASERR